MAKERAKLKAVFLEMVRLGETQECQANLIAKIPTEMKLIE